ncbi:hypothetical protein TRFO_19043 [Tritrichomonas foetus]|uniref:Cyclin N-terminal domain-containing protein n=1 Tax=Tritrichomonas foetus TaxID=1144522 RepID=A0A1J4KPZ5_9EUKA|nr:hypothetical protein TRFO_19043 [Tritrichomonas foetus]|eukprot:OHT11501.1 hypothetical protein TRFO_19043 [Tritrichomonas foetus]
MQMLQSTSREDTFDPNATGSHEEFWVFSQVSQWGSNWVYSDYDYLRKVRSIACIIRQTGLKNKHSPRMVHYAQMLIWRFYLKEKVENYSETEIIDAALESAAHLLETHSARDTSRDPSGGQARATNSDQFKQHFRLVRSLDFNIRIKHPSEYIPLFTSSQFTSRLYQLAECIISDSFISPCCLLHPPIRVAEGAVIMAAGMMNQPGVVTPKSAKSISFIKDMKFYYNLK